MKRGIWFIIGLATLCANAQRTGTTTLVIEVRPEAHITPARINLQFRVSADGASDVTTQTETISAWVRALPGQPIRITARSSASFGVVWNGAVTRATQGAQGAACTNGAFEGAGARDLVAEWGRSGILSCAVTFSLVEARRLPPGSYTATVDLAVE